MDPQQNKPKPQLKDRLKSIFTFSASQKEPFTPEQAAKYAAYQERRRKLTRKLELLFIIFFGLAMAAVALLDMVFGIKPQPHIILLCALGSLVVYAPIAWLVLRPKVKKQSFGPDKPVDSDPK